MQDLRLVGVHEDGQHLLLAGDAGTRFRLPLDDALRAAARRDRPRLGQLQIELDGGLRPREVQALIRSGLSADEVADRAGWSVDKVRRYEGPVLAEREHVAGLARGVRMRGHGRSTDGETLSTRVTHRLTGRGVDPGSATWDAARDAEGRWTVVVLFSAGGRERTATWLFDVPDRTVTARDDEARWLSEDDADQSGPIPSPHQPAPTAAPTTVYDVESDGGVAGARVRRRPQDPIDLMAAMRESSRVRRPRRRVHQPTLTPLDDEPREDAVPLEQVDHDPDGGQLPPAARGEHPLDAETIAEPVVGDQAGAGDALTDDEVQAAAASEGPTLPESEAVAQPAEPADEADKAAPTPEASGPTRAIRSVPDLAEEDSELPDDASTTDAGPDADTPSRETTASHNETPQPAAPTTADADAPEPAAAAAPARPRRGGRPSVPRWDDIMFGAKAPMAERTDD